MQPAPPAIVARVVETPVHETTIGDVILGALGLTGVLLLAAAVFGALLGALLVARRKFRVSHDIPEDESQRLGITEAR